MKIFYGLTDNRIDVTALCYKNLQIRNSIIIPSGDELRSSYFSDPAFGIKKSVFITSEENVTTEYDHTKSIFIDIASKAILINYKPDLHLVPIVDNKLKKIHEALKINYGGFNQELPEQKMVTRYLTGNEKILEIGGNIGRNSLVIGSILGNNNNNLVVLESDSDIFNKLKENRDLNNMHFNIENSALSNRKLIQKGWDTIVSDTLLPGYKNVNIITYKQIQEKYNILFDTLVLDCEGAFYYILLDMPEILANIKLIIMENDYRDINHKNYIDDTLRSNEFYVDYREAGGWGPCIGNFFEVWKKI